MSMNGPSDFWNDFTAPMPDGYSPPDTGHVNALNSPSNPNCMTEDEGTEVLSMGVESD